MPNPPEQHRAVPALRVAAGVVLLLALIDAIGNVVPWIRANELGLFAAAFLLVPGWADPNLPGPLERRAPWRPLRPLGWATAITGLILLGFLPTFHLWQTALAEQQLAPSLHAFERPPERYLGQPIEPGPGQLTVYHLDERVVVALHADAAPWRIQIGTDGTLHTSSNGVEGANRVVAAGEVPRTATIVVRPRNASELTVDASIAGNPVAAEQIRIGAAGRLPQAADIVEHTLRIPLHLTWLPMMVLVQLLLIALPEEYFFRRYLQHHLAQHTGLGRRWSLGAGLFLSPAIVISSAIFALLHFAVGLDPARLAVFFPSLLFGWLHDRTQSLLAPVLVHAACNLMVLLASTQYLPA